MFVAVDAVVVFCYCCSLSVIILELNAAFFRVISNYTVMSLKGALIIECVLISRLQQNRREQKKPVGGRLVAKMCVHHYTGCALSALGTLQDFTILIIYSLCLHVRGTADAKIKVLSVGNPELTNVLPLKPGVGQKVATHVLPAARNSSLS